MEDLKIKNKSTKLTSKFEECIQIAELALNDVRTLSLDLRPAKLDDLGLTAALRWLLDRQANVAGFNAHFQEDHISGHDLPKHLEITSFRVAQEALTNVVRHAHSDNVFLKLFRKGHELRISIQDDGKGFVVSDAFEKTHKGQCLGLLGMQERVALASGRLKITSSAERGTKVLAVFPLTQPNEEIL
jgi:signal transduction histidine kinase